MGNYVWFYKSVLVKYLFCSFFRVGVDHAERQMGKANSKTKYNRRYNEQEWVHVQVHGCWQGYGCGHDITTWDFSDSKPTFMIWIPHLGFKNQIWLLPILSIKGLWHGFWRKIIWVSKTKFGFSNYHLKTKFSHLKIKFINSKTVFRKPYLYLKHTFGLCIEIRIYFLKTKFVLFQKTEFVF